MHCRFFSDHLVNAYAEICTGRPLTRPLEMVKLFIDKMNDPVLMLGDANSARLVYCVASMQGPSQKVYIMFTTVSDDK